jgi:hypothetical protein
MEYILIIVLIIVIIMILYILYEFYINTNTSSIDNVYELIDLNTPPIETIPSKSLTNPTSARYSIGGWIYINSWNSNDYKTLITKTEFKTNNDTFSDISYDADFSLYLDKTQPNLIYQLNSIQSGIPIKPIVIMHGFPLQTWTHFIISIDTQILDAYINGKLVISHKLEALPQITYAGIIFGNGIPMDIKINSFKRWETSIDPQTAWDTFLSTKPY